jgi:phage terminase small subunit
MGTLQNTGTPLADGMARFVGRLLEGDSPTQAARVAGYAEPTNTGAALIRHPLVRKALADAAAAQIECELVPLSLKVAREILEDTEPKAVAVRAKLALGLLDRAAKNRQTDEDPSKALSKMSNDELAALVAKGLAAEAQEAQTINITPVSGHNSAPRG